MAFLPMNAKEVRDRGWSEVDFVYVCGDSYVDHPSFGAAIITRVLEDCGYKTAFLAQPNWKNDDDFTQFGKPRLGFIQCIRESKRIFIKIHRAWMTLRSPCRR